MVVQFEVSLMMNNHKTLYVYFVEKVLQCKKKNVKVQWFGFDKSHDCWI